MADRRDGFVLGEEVAHGAQQRLVQPQVLRRAAAGNHQGVIALGPHVGEGGVEGEVVPPLLRVRLIAFEVVNGGADLVPGLLPWTHGVDGVSHGEEGLERHHDFVVFREVSDQHQDRLCHGATYFLEGVISVTGRSQ